MFFFVVVVVLSLRQSQSEQRVSCFIFEACISFLGFSSEVVLLNITDMLNTAIVSVKLYLLSV